MNAGWEGRRIPLRGKACPSPHNPHMVVESWIILTGGSGMRKLAFALSLLLLSSHAYALDVAGVNLAPTVVVRGKTLTLNGAGIRKKFFFKVYVGALYTERRVSNLEEISSDPGEKLVRMIFVHKKVEKKKIVEAFAEGLSENAPRLSRSAEANAFLSWFTSDFVAGDTVDIFVSPDGTLAATQNGRLLGTLRSPSLSQGVLMIWLGTRPADVDLRNAMFGK